MGEMKGAIFEITEGGRSVDVEEYFSILQLRTNVMVKFQTGKIEWN